MKDKRGFILMLTFIFMAALTFLVVALIYMGNVLTKDVGAVTADYKMLELADAGVERAHRAIRDDYLTTTWTGTAQLRGGDTSLCSGVTYPARISYIDNSAATFTTGTAVLRALDANYTNTRIISVVLWACASRATSGSGSNQIVVGYTVDGTNYTTSFTTPTLTTTRTNYSGDITADRPWTWPILMSPNFRARAMRSGTGTRTVNLDALWLTVTYSIDTLTEPWAIGSYASFPITLGSGAIQSISITDEQGKVHLNYASQDLLTNLFTNLGISNPSTKATAVVNYRGASLTNPFDSVEELKQVSGFSDADYAAVKDYVTAYSYISTYVFRPPAYVAGSPGSRVPINVNTAPQVVLKSVFDSSNLGAGDANTLANAIVSRRNIAPFQGFYSYTAVASDYTYFLNFVQSQTGYLTVAQRNRVLDTADSSALIPVSGAAAFNCPTAELCYASSTFYINSLARVGTRNYRVKTIIGNDGSRTFSTYVGDPAPRGWRKENFE